MNNICVEQDRCANTILISTNKFNINGVKLKVVKNVVMEKSFSNNLFIIIMILYLR
jgi:hypothetical protein